MSTAVADARRIAREDLRACRTPEGIIAGTHHFVDVWARDALFATFGCIGKKDAPAAKTTIETFLRFQRADGLIPYRVMRSRSTFHKYFGRPQFLKTPRANFRSHQSGGTVPDGGLLTVIAAALYVRRTGDKTFLKRHYPGLRKSVAWYERRFQGGLIREWVQCEWADAVLKFGTVLYTNVLYLKAFRDMQYLAGATGNGNAAAAYKRQYSRMHELFERTFWNGTYYSDWVDYRRHDFVASHPNLLAILFGIADAGQSRSILSVIGRVSLADFTVETNYPKYPFWRVPLIQFAAGVADYHNRGCLWLQPGIMYAAALWKCGEKRKSRAFLQQIAGQIVRYGRVFEVYEKNGMPVRRSIYTSEGPFAWSAGLFLWAAATIR